jgi:hypothetical protein
MEVDGSLYKLGDDPKAILVSSYTQFENLNFLAMFRHYDIDFDNPYQRSFSESERYDDTVFDNLAYGLRNTLLSDLYLNSVQPSAERGFYFETRYQFHRMFTITKAYIDLWERLSDARRGLRFQGTLQFRPIHQLRFRLRHKIQSKKYDEDLDRGRSITTESQLDLQVFLSNYDQIAFSFVNLEVDQPPYLSILSDPALANAPDMAQAVSQSNGTMMGVEYVHNFNENLKIVGDFSIWKAYGATFWDYEDVELDFDQTDRGFKYWFHLHSRISSNLFLSIKYKYKQFLTRQVEFREYNEIPEEGEWYFKKVENKQNIIRLQLDWKF